MATTENSNKPINVAEITDDELTDLLNDIANELEHRAPAKEDAKTKRIAALRAELAELTDDYPDPDEEEARTASDPTCDPAPWLTSFGGNWGMKPYDKHYLGEAALVVGVLAYNHIIPLIPPANQRNDDLGADLCLAIMLISRGMWAVRYDQRLDVLYDAPLRDFESED